MISSTSNEQVKLLNTNMVLLEIIFKKNNVNIIDVISAQIETAMKGINWGSSNSMLWNIYHWKMFLVATT
jgi:hypothetical protein